MVEYAVLLAFNASNVVTLVGNDVVFWVSGPNWPKIAIAALALISLRMGIWAFKGR
jgi:Flp pilus assembly pilin Flp